MCEPKERIAVLHTSVETRQLYRYLRRGCGFQRDVANFMVAGHCLAEVGHGRVGVGGVNLHIGELLAMTANGRDVDNAEVVAP